MTRIILIGYMGAGKTTIGKVLAREMGLEFYDLDNYIEDRFHQKIPDIFADKGEEGFVRWKGKCCMRWQSSRMSSSRVVEVRLVSSIIWTI